MIIMVMTKIIRVRTVVITRIVTLMMIISLWLYGDIGTHWGNLRALLVCNLIPWSALNSSYHFLFHYLAITPR